MIVLTLEFTGTPLLVTGAGDTTWPHPNNACVLSLTTHCGLKLGDLKNWLQAFTVT
jgi:hypothetical protein